MADSLDICDPVLAFDQIMEEIGIEQYLKPEPLYRYGRPGYNRVNMLKTILFGFMDTGYTSLKELEDWCRVNIRYMYLMDYETPSYRASGYFINEEINGNAEDIFQAVMEYMLQDSLYVMDYYFAPVSHRCTSLQHNRSPKSIGGLLQGSLAITLTRLSLTSR